MDNAIKSLENNALAALSARAPQGIVSAIKTASAKTGVSFSYLMEKAAAESNFNATAKAKTSSATGLFQFIESTWMDMVNRHGAKYGINTDQSKANLLNLRKNPQIASLMAGEFAQSNKAHLQQTIGGKIGNTELYFAHFMGAGGASAFLSQFKKNPLSIGADLFPKEARANKNVFYDSKTGAPKTLGQIYDFFDKKFSSDPAPARPDTMAYKSNRKSYQLLPPSEERYVRVKNTNLYAQNSLYQMQRQLDAFFSPVHSFDNNAFPTSLYGNLNSPTSVFLNILKN